MQQKNMNEVKNFYDKNLFIKNSINLNFLNNQNFLERLGKTLLDLSSTKVFPAKLAIGGEYHKNYYNCIKNGFMGENSGVLELKNAKFGVFGEMIKQNLCNFGIYFYSKRKKIYIKIFCGNGFLIEKTIQNYITKHINI